MSRGVGIVRDVSKRCFAGAAMAVLVVALLSCLATPAAAQRPTQAQQNAIRQSCRSDYQANCSGVPTGGSAALACLQQHSSQLSPPCNNAVMAVGGPNGNAPAGNTPAGNDMAPPAAPPAASAGPPMSPRQQMAALRSYCGEDYRRLCRGVRPGGGRGIQCLQDNAPSLSGGCQGALSHAAR
jgi:Cysteine rich repeat